MRTSVLWRKIARIILMISEDMGISSEEALICFYESHVYQLLIEPKYGLQLMSDLYVFEEFKKEQQNASSLSEEK